MTRDYWKRQAADFAGYYGNRNPFSPKRLVSRFLDARTRLLVSLVPHDEDATILDLGCGSGIHMKLLAPRCRRITGVDISEQMIAQAEKEISTIDKKKWELKVADAQRLPFPGKSFNVIVSMGLLDYVPSPRRVLSECRRVLRRAGMVVLTMPKKPSLFFFLRTPLGNVVRRTVFGLPPIRNAVSREGMGDLLESAGFDIGHMQSLWGTMWVVTAWEAGCEKGEGNC